MKFTAQRIALAAIVMALALLAGLGVYAWRSTARLAAEGADLARTQRVLALLAALQSSVFEAESALRGHALSGDPALLEPFRRAKDGANGRLADLRATDAPSAERYERLVALGALIARRFDGLTAAIDLRSRGGPAAVSQWESNGEGKRIDDRLRAAMGELQLHAEAERQAIQQRSVATTRTAQGATLACSLGAMGIAGIALLRLLAVSRNLQFARAQHLGSSNSQFRADNERERLFELAPDAVCVLDAEGRVTRVSAGAEKLWGWGAQELIGKPAFEKVLPEDHRRTEQALAAVRADAAAHTLRNRWRRKDGSTAQLQWTAQWSAQDGNMICVARDLTEAERLRGAVARQTEALRSGHAELERAVARADTALGLQAVFVAAVGPALRAPAEAILSRSAVMLQDQKPPLDAAQGQQWAQVHEAADALHEAVADVLDCGAVDAGQVTLKKEAFDVWETLKQVAAGARPFAERKGLDFRLQLADDLGYARGDTRRVEQVLRKLLHEAISATDLGIVALHASRPGAALVRIEVHDGALLPGDPAQLFAPLQAGGAATAAPSALSLALMLSHRLARLMGGDLAARKGAVQGRVFVLTLPSDDLPAA